MKSLLLNLRKQRNIQTWVSLVSPLQLPGLGHPVHMAQPRALPLCVAEAQAQSCTNPASHLPCTQLSFDPQPDLSLGGGKTQQEGVQATEKSQRQGDQG